VGDPLREEVGKLAKNVGELVSKLDGDTEERVKTEGRLSTLETKVLVMMWFLAVVGAGTVTAIIAWIQKGR
jgi:hypothetical protein